MSRRVVEELKKLRETNGFLRGMVSYVGFKQTAVEFDRSERFKGQSKYGRFLGSIQIGFNGIFGFSNALLSWVLLSGLVVATLSFIFMLVIIVTKIMGFPYPAGIPAVLSFILFMGGIQLICFGILGEYIGRIYDDVKQRPMYVVAEFVNPPDGADGPGGTGGAGGPGK
jgi:dolichol-phosphate mannosyltransferase